MQEWVCAGKKTQTQQFCFEVFFIFLSPTFLFLVFETQNARSEKNKRTRQQGQRGKKIQTRRVVEKIDLDWMRRLCGNGTLRNHGPCATVQ